MAVTGHGNSVSSPQILLAILEPNDQRTVQDKSSNMTTRGVILDF